MMNCAVIGDLSAGESHGRGFKPTGGASNPDMRGREIWENFQEKVAPELSPKGHIQSEVEPRLKG